MTPTTLPEYRAEVLAFAEAYPTPAVRRMVSLCERGYVSWVDAYNLARKALAAGIADRDARAEASA